MSVLRRYLPRLAALVLLVWLLAAGTAFAQACASTAHLGCEECCTHVDPAAPATAATAAVPVSPEQPAPLWPPAPGAGSAQVAAAGAPLAQPPPRQVAPPRIRIPIAFLRLAL